MLDTFRQDLRAGLRSYSRSPAFALTAVLTLALGVGLSVAMFSVANTLLLRRLPVLDQSRIVVLWGKSPDGKYDNFPLRSTDDAASFARQSRSLASVAFFAREGAWPLPVTLDGGLVRLRRSIVSAAFFDVLGTEPILGRSFRSEDDARGAAPVAVLSYAAWQRQFGGDRTVIGRRFTGYSSGFQLTIVGVMPQGLDYPHGVDFWTPVIPATTTAGNDHPFAELDVIGRLAGGASDVAARDELTAFFAREGASKLERSIAGVVTPFPELVLGDVKPAVIAFTVAVGLLLLITCINVANLLLVRGIGRTREISVRSALGASRLRLVRQLLTETAIIALVGGVLGVVIGAAALRAFVALAPTDLPRLDELHAGAGVLVVALGVTTIAAMVFGVAPAVIAARGNVADDLRGTRQSGSVRARRVTRGLVVGQMALALVVLSAAALLSRSLIALEHVDLAFNPSRLVIGELTLRGNRFGDREKQTALLDQLLPRIKALPGVEAVSPVWLPPFSGTGIDFQPTVEGQAADDAAKNPIASVEPISTDYFSTLQVPVIQGRSFTNADRADALKVAIVSRSFAARLWPGADPIGKRIKGSLSQMLTVVGVVADSRYYDLRAPRLAMYIPIRQSVFPAAPMTLAVRMRRNQDVIIPALRAAIASVDPGVELANARTVNELLAAPLAHPRLNAVLLGAFAVSALALAAVGLFGVMSATVRQRTGEIGIRMALGATAAEIGRLVLVQGVSVAAIGIPIGFGLSIAAARLLRGILYDVSPFDAVSLCIATAVLLAVAAIAASLPALAGARIDPLVALRRDI